MHSKQYLSPPFSTTHPHVACHPIWNLGPVTTLQRYQKAVLRASYTQQGPCQDYLASVPFVHSTFPHNMQGSYGKRFLCFPSCPWETRNNHLVNPHSSFTRHIFLLSGGETLKCWKMFLIKSRRKPHIHKPFT